MLALPLSNLLETTDMHLSPFISACVCMVQFQVQEAELALQLYASDADRARIRFAVSETATLDYAYTCALHHAIFIHPSSGSHILC